MLRKKRLCDIFFTKFAHENLTNYETNAIMITEDIDAICIDPRGKAHSVHPRNPRTKRRNDYEERDYYQP